MLLVESRKLVDRPKATHLSMLVHRKYKLPRCACVSSIAPGAISKFLKIVDFPCESISMQEATYGFVDIWSTILLLRACPWSVHIH